MTIGSVYEKFGIPKNLIEHMLRVAGVVIFIEKNWNGENLDWNLLQKIALLHDLGNVVKFTFETPNKFGLSDQEVKRLEVVQKETIAKYGSDDHVATENMLEEIGADLRIKKVIQAKSFGNSVVLSKSDDWYGKILSYADMRVMPFGICSVEERLMDVSGRIPKYANRPDFEDLCNAVREIEKQIQKNLTVDLKEIKDENIKADLDFLSLEL